MSIRRQRVENENHRGDSNGQVVNEASVDLEEIITSHSCVRGTHEQDDDDINILEGFCQVVLSGRWPRWKGLRRRQIY